MHSININGLTLWYETGEKETADLVRPVVEKTVQLTRSRWGVETPEDLHFHVMTSWLGFLFRAPPWLWRIYLGISLPLWFSRVKKLWRYAGGWSQQFGARHVAAVKPARLIEQADRSLGQRIFVQEENIEEKVRHTACHELTHALTSQLKLPNWLNEGLAMVGVDRCFEKSTVQPATLDLLEGGKKTGDQVIKLRITEGRKDAIVQLYVRGYWTTRFLDEAHPDLLKSVLSGRRSHEALEAELAAGLGVDRAAFWEQTLGCAAAHFK
ncbi:MAG: hypothetical protein ACYTG7_09710 [Planctomycetota bacterium]|jgi:hypothetical protein